jgi:large subunit ribosomal protein L30
MIMATAKKVTTQIKVKLIRSLYGQLKANSASVRGLGLRRMNQTVTVADTPENRGMIYAARHMLQVEQI